MSHELDRRIADLARRQHGAFARPQVLSAGGTDRQISGRLREGLWLRTADPGIYVLPSAPPARELTWMIAALGHPRAVVSGRSAAELCGFPDVRARRPEVTLPLEHKHTSNLATVRRSRFICRTTRANIPVMRPEQTVIDLASTLPVAALEELVSDAVVAEVLALEQLSGRFATLAHSRLAGIAKVRTVLEHLDHGEAPPASVLERLLYAVLDRPGLPTYQRQASAPWWSPADERVDALISSWRLVVEADGRRWHTRIRDTVNDKRRDNLAAAHGYRVMRFGWEDLRHTPDDVEHILVRAGRAWSDLLSGASPSPPIATPIADLFGG